MTTIGLIGGMSHESTVIYYRRLNEVVRAKRGGLSAADILLRSLDFGPIAALQAEGRWDEARDILAAVARQLTAAGAGVIGLATNTMHKVADGIVAATAVPFIHIATPTAAALAADGRRRPLLLATRFTMEETFYIDRLRAEGLIPLVPEAPDRARVHGIIYDELCRGVVTEPSRHVYEAIIRRGAEAGADSVILGCTEICLLISQANSVLPVYDTTELHIAALADAALSCA